MKRIRSSPRNRSPRAAQNINLPHDLAREIRNSSTLSTPHFHSVGSARLLRTKDRKVHARRNPTIKIYPVSMQTHRCAQISRDSVYVQTGGGGQRERERVVACLADRTILACSSQHRLGENYGRDSNKKDTTLSRLCFYLPYYTSRCCLPPATRIRMYRGKGDRPSFLSNGPLFHFPFISSRYQIIVGSHYALPMADFNFDDVGNAPAVVAVH